MQPDIYISNRYVSITKLQKIIGTYACALLCKRFGGQEDISIPATTKSESPLRNVIGDNNFARLVAVAGGFSVSLPKAIATKKAAIMLALERGAETSSQIAARFNVTQRYVRMLRSELRNAGVVTPTQRPGNLPGIKKEAIILAFRSGVGSLDEIAAKTGASRKYVKDVIGGHMGDQK